MEGSDTIILEPDYRKVRAEALTSAVRDHDSCSLDCKVPVSLTEIVGIANYLSNLDETGKDPDEVIAKLPNPGAYLLDNETLGFVLDTARDEVDNLLSNLSSGGRRQAKTASNA